MTDLARRDADPKVAQVRERYQRLRDGGADPHEWAYAWRTELNRGGFRAVDFLMQEIVDTGKCIGCASCVTICPVDVFDYVDERPIDTRTDACVFCVLCADVCPVLRPVDRDFRTLLEFREPAIDEGFGHYAYGAYARATDPEILARGQDGGVVSAMLVHALETGQLGGAILGDIDPENPQIGAQTIATNRAEVLACAGSRYTYSPNTLALQEAMRQDIKPLAVVGVPCQIDGVRLQQHSSIRLAMADWYRENIALTFGLFCSESFTQESLVKLGEIIDVDPLRIENIQHQGQSRGPDGRRRGDQHITTGLPPVGPTGMPLLPGLRCRERRHRDGRHRDGRLDAHARSHRTWPRGIPGGIGRGHHRRPAPRGRAPRYGSDAEALVVEEAQ